MVAGSPSLMHETNFISESIFIWTFYFFTLYFCPEITFWIFLYITSIKKTGIFGF